MWGINMSKVYLDDSILTDIADAIREKTGESGTITPANMPTEIEGISGGGEPIVIDDYGTDANYFIKSFICINDTVTFKPKNLDLNLLCASMQFQAPNNKIIIDCANIDRNNVNTNLNGFLRYCQLNSINNIEIKNYEDISSRIGASTTIAYDSMFYNSQYIESIPDDIYNFIMDRVQKTIYTADSNNPNFGSCFYNCDNLRGEKADTFRSKIVSCAIQSRFTNTISQVNYNCYFQPYFHNLQIDPFYNYRKQASGTVFLISSSMLYNCGLRHIVFKPFDTNSEYYYYPNLYIDLSTNVGWCVSKNKQNTNGISNLNFYNLYKDNVNYWFWNKDYSGYNHDSAVETINSLPDMTLNKNTASGLTYTIKFAGSEGSGTDEGAINTLTEAEIAVASDKGWTVTLS